MAQQTTASLLMVLCVTAGLLSFQACVCKGSKLVRCFTEPSSARCHAYEPHFTTHTIRECCVNSSNGHFYQMIYGDTSCHSCIIVFGWLNGTEIFTSESYSETKLEVGFIKGGVVQTFAQLGARNTARFRINITAGSTSQGINAYFSDIQRTIVEFSPNTTSVTVYFPYIPPDGIALERSENFSLTLVGANFAGRSFLASTDSNVFVIPTIHIIIEDNDIASLQFTESGYSGIESSRKITTIVQLLTDIATDLIIAVVPVNFTFVATQIGLPSSFPNEYWSSTTNASSQDFSNTPVLITFPALAAGPTAKLVDIEIVDDDIHETDQVFVLLLGVVDALKPDKVDLRSGCFASRGKILDDDYPIHIGFEQERYTVFEEFNATGELITIPVIKGNNQKTELTFDIITMISKGYDPSTDAQADIDYYGHITRRTTPFRSDDVRVIGAAFSLINDAIIEVAEEFQIMLFVERGKHIMVGGLPNLFASTTVIIIDTDELTIGWERNLTTVNETHGFLELCLIIRNIDYYEILTGFSLLLFIGTNRGTAADPGDYTELRTDTSAIYLGGEIHRGCINIHITDDILLEEVEFFSVQAIPPEGGLPQRVFLDPDLTFVEIMDNDFMVIGWEKAMTSVSESVGVVELCVRIMNIPTEIELPAGIRVILSVITLRGTAGPGDYRQLFYDRFTAINDANRRACIEIEIIDDILPEVVETFSVLAVADPFDQQGLPANVYLMPIITVIKVLDNDH